MFELGFEWENIIYDPKMFSKFKERFITIVLSYQTKFSDKEFVKNVIFKKGLFLKNDKKI